MQDLLIYLVSMVVMVPLSKKLGVGSIIGYLGAGALVGAQGFGLLHGSQEDASQIAEFGVIMMMLLIGLELNPRLLWKLRGPIFGMGSLQVIGTTILFGIVGLYFKLTWQSAITLGMTVAVSSTAIALQTLKEKGYSKSVGGERTFSVLLFQDMAVVPMIALLPILGSGIGDEVTEADQRNSLMVIAAVATLILAGRFIIRPLFKIVARTKTRENFTALALLIVVGAAALMHHVGLSPALGGFLAGVILADSEFRHQVEADIEPFKGLLLGLFFITVGASIRFDLIAAQPGQVLLWVFTIIVGKSVLTYALARWCRLRPPESLLFAVSLSQGGEFAFVLLAQVGDLLTSEMVQILTASVAVSMAIAPILINLAITKGMSRLECVTPTERLPDVVDESEKDNPVLVVGVGRFGQTLIRFLRANGYQATVLDIDSEQIDVMARFGIKSYFGDGSNPDLLHAAGLDRAKVLVLAIDEPETALKIVETIRPLYPKLPIYSRAFDRVHAYSLIHHGVTDVAIETSGSAVIMGVEILKTLGVDAERAQSVGRLFHVNNHRSIFALAKQYHEVDQETFIQSSRQMSEQLEALLRSDPEQLLRGATSEWKPRAEV